MLCQTFLIKDIHVCHSHLVFPTKLEPPIMIETICTLLQLKEDKQSGMIFCETRLMDCNRFTIYISTTTTKNNPNWKHYMLGKSTEKNIIWKTIWRYPSSENLLVNILKTNVLIFINVHFCKTFKTFIIPKTYEWGLCMICNIGQLIGNMYGNTHISVIL